MLEFSKFSVTSMFQYMETSQLIARQVNWLLVSIWHIALKWTKQSVLTLWLAILLVKYQVKLAGLL